MASLRSRRTLRPAGFDELGLRRAISDRMLPFLVAAMAFLAALALAGWVGAASLARHWQQGAGSAVTVQVPRPREPAAQGGGTRLDRVLALLVGTPGIASARALSDEELGELLRPWLGSGAERLAVPLPAVIAVRLADAGPGARPAGAPAGRGGAGHAGREPRCLDPAPVRAGAQPAGLRRGWRCCWWRRWPPR